MTHRLSCDRSTAPSAPAAAECDHTTNCDARVSLSRRRFAAGAAWFPAVAGLSALAAGCRTSGSNPVRLDGPFVPTPMPVVDAMLDMARVTQEDLVYDLGSGDGRIVLRAADRFGARGVGVDLNPDRVAEARAMANAMGPRIEQLVRFEVGNVYTFDFTAATVVTLYLFPSVNLKLRPRLLRELKPGTRVVSHQFDMGAWEPEEVRYLGNRTVYRWTVMANPPAALLN
jgi:SAM-dependent methyltransferase